MFGAIGRGALYIPIAVLISGIIQFITPFFLPYLGAQDSLMFLSFEFLAGNALFIMLAAIAAGVLSRAYVVSNPGVR
jgi:hypothetical protein